MSGGQQLGRAAAAIQAAASAAGDSSGNCDAAVSWFEVGNMPRTAEQLEWAEDNARSALHRIKEAREQLAKLPA